MATSGSASAGEITRSLSGRFYVSPIMFVGADLFGNSVQMFSEGKNIVVSV